MHIVSAGVHDARVLRLVIDFIGLHDRQRIHVSAKRDGALVGVLPLQQSHYARIRHALKVRDPELLQPLLYEPLRLELLKRKLRMLMQVPTTGDDRGVVLAGEGADRFEEGHLWELRGTRGEGCVRRRRNVGRNLFEILPCLVLILVDSLLVKLLICLIWCF